MTDEELEKEFDKLFWSDIHPDCWAPSCELRDCCECSTYQDCFAEYKEDLGYVPFIGVTE